ncbi:MAG TPA: cyclase family protein [Thermoanaerobaculia bacterium]|nr:cyclase family protein [Thermoanaerobaculia bacterium]
MPRFLDISPVVTERIGVWPGDVPYRRRSSLSIEGGANIDLSSVESTLHVGAHADAPSHYLAGGRTIAEQPLEPYLGPCQVIDARAARGSRILMADLAAPVQAPRVLLRTGTFPDPDSFTTDFASLAVSLVEELAASGVLLVGIDTPSVDPFDDKALEAHHALARSGMANLEGLVLDAVEPGLYTLVALPLRLAGADASPVRAVLIRE